MRPVGGLVVPRRDWEQGVVAQALLEAGDEDPAFRLARAAPIPLHGRQRDDPGFVQNVFGAPDSESPVSLLKGGPFFCS